jgi:hypothetical protein
MSTKFFSATRLVCAALFFLLLVGATARAANPDDLNLVAQLVTGTNDPHSTNGVPVTVKVAKKLSRLPLKWQYYFVVNSQQFTLAKNEYKEVSLSDACQFSVKNIGGEQVQFALMGHGLNVSKIKQSLKKGQTLVTGSDAENSLIVLRQAD